LGIREVNRSDIAAVGGKGANPGSLSTLEGFSA
jgi:hypothetical protein